MSRTAGCWQQTIFHGPGIDQPYAFITDTDGSCSPSWGIFAEPARYLTTDGLGSITSLVYNTGGFSGTLALGERYFFTAREFDFDTGLQHNRARDYDPKTGRFMQEDPTGIWATDLNLYRYALGNPINRTDPNGLDSYIATQFGHEILIVDDPDNPGGTIAFDFFPTAGTLKSVFASVPGTVREEKYPPGEKPRWSVDIPFTRKKQTSAEDRETIERARQLKRAAESGDLKFRAMVSDPNCIGFAVATQSGAE